MATVDDANLILRLYELRREEVMRKARNYVLLEFQPQSFEEIISLFTDTEHPERNAYFRQVVTYWDMAAALVNHGALNPELFFETSGEYLAVWSKVSDFIPQLRKPEAFGPQFLVNLEKLVQRQPNSAERVQWLKERFKEIAARRAAAQKQTQ
jgi:hypothetical protein